MLEIGPESNYQLDKPSHRNLSGGEITLALFKPRAKQFSPEGERVTLVLWSIVQIRKSAKQKLPLDFPWFAFFISFSSPNYPE
ncbi:unnamed protein product [Heterobilharzia americana]|nr:unnamed protein product [Heterobilharzia americana]